MSPAGGRAVAVIVTVLLLLAFVPAGSSLESPSRTNFGGGSAIAAQGAPEADTTVTRIEIAENGSARWSVTVRTHLANESEVDDYEAFQAEFRSNRDAYVDRFERRMRGVVAGASSASDRNMTASSFRAETSIQEVPRRWGIVTYSFRWTNFAAVEKNAVIVGDVFDGGLYLGEDDRLEIVPPNGYAPAETSPPPDETEGTTVVWTGAEDFADRQPMVRFELTEVAAPRDGETPKPLGVSLLAVGVTSVSLLALAGIAVAVVSDRRRLRQFRSKWPGVATASNESSKDVSGGGGNGVDGSNRSDSIDDSAPPLDSGLLTDEDRVQRLLERNGGRMRQAAIAEELGWSPSKTSRVVSGMAEDDVVEKLRIGRENVIDLVAESD